MFCNTFCALSSPGVDLNMTHGINSDGTAQMQAGGLRLVVPGAFSHRFDHGTCDEFTQNHPPCRCKAGLSLGPNLCCHLLTQLARKLPRQLLTALKPAHMLLWQTKLQVRSLGLITMAGSNHSGSIAFTKVPSRHAVPISPTALHPDQTSC